MFLPRIYPITDVGLSGLSHGAQVEKMFAGGARFVQLRDKYAAPRDFMAGAARVLEIARTRGAKIIINDRADIALALDADGVHLGQDDLPPAEARKILGDKAIIGFSTHNLNQAVSAIALPVDYIAVGPIFATQTKEKPDAVVGLETLKKIRAVVGSFPLVAIGGITFENYNDVLNAGADSVAIIGDLLGEPDKITEKLVEFGA